MKSLSNTRWVCRAVNAIKNNYIALIQAIKEIKRSIKIPEVRSTGNGLLSQLKHFHFIIALEMMEPVLNIINKMSKMLQSENIDLLIVMNSVEGLRKALLQMRNEEKFHKIYKKCESTCHKMEIFRPEVKNIKYLRVPI